MSRSETDSEAPRGVSGGLAGGLFLISVAILALQVLQTRILSVQMWHHHSYMVVTMTLLGFGVAGALVTVAPGLVRQNLRRNLAWSGTLFAVSTIGGYLLLGATADRAADMSTSGSYVAMSLFYSYLLVPYFFGGLVVTLVLSGGANVHRLYFVNLVGSAVGAWVFVATITPLGAEKLLVLCAVTGPLAAVAFLAGTPAVEREQESGRGLAIGAALLVIALCGAAFVRAEDWLEVKIAKSKAEWAVLHGRGTTEGAELLETRWSPLCRLDLVKLPDRTLPDGTVVAAPINIYQDGDAITVMHSDASWESVPKAALNTLAYVPHVLRREVEGGPGPDALAIGIGGGIDLRHGLEQGANSVLGIEINGTTVELVGEDYADFNGDVYHRPGVEVVVGEGRSTLRRLDRKFDVIELSGTDTYTAGNSGAYVLSESYLYTSEALREYFEHLTDRGTLGIIRLAYDPPRETLRLFALALEELRGLGIEKPSDHAVVIYKEVFDPEVNTVVRFAAGVFSMQPFGAKEIEAYRLADLSQIFRVAYVPGMEEENPFTELGAAIDAGTEQAFYDDYTWDVSPVGDDSPFFFNFHHWSALFEEPEDASEEWYQLTGGPIGLKILATLLIQTSVLTGLLVILPLVFLRRGGLAAPHAWRHLVYFLGLGAGFMFLEISTVQRLVLYLGHPTYSLTVTLSCFLFFAGLGSLWSSRFEATSGAALRKVVSLLAVAIVVVFAGLELVLDATLALELPLRVLVVVAVLAPLNFLMGVPFPVGLARLKRLAPNLVPWALGANGGASVVGSILCIVLAMESGFRSVSLIAAGIYLVGMLLVTTGPLAPKRSGG